MPPGEISLRRNVERFPYVPSDSRERDERCYEAYNIQVHALMKRMLSTGTQRIVIGVSGGLDSTHALIVAAKTTDRLGLPRDRILGYTMPGFATSDITLKNALSLMRTLQITSSEIDIRPSCRQMLSDLGHPFSRGERVYDIRLKTSRPASARRICSGLPTFITELFWEPAISASWRLAGAPTGLATTCRIIT